MSAYRVFEVLMLAALLLYSLRQLLLAFPGGTQWLLRTRAGRRCLPQNLLALQDRATQPGACASCNSCAGCGQKPAVQQHVIILQRSNESRLNPHA